MLNALYYLVCSSQQSQVVDIVIISILYMEKLRHQEVKCLALGYAGGKRWHLTLTLKRYCLNFTGLFQKDVGMCVFLNSVSMHGKYIDCKTWR